MMSMGSSDERSTELLHSQAHIWNQTLNFINSASLKCAVQLGIPDAIHRHGKPMTLDQLVAALSIKQAKARSVYRLMRILVHSGFVVQEKVGDQDGLVTEVLIKECKGVFEGLTSLVDVGGGTGTVSRAIAKTFPQLKCTVLDLPNVVAGLEGTENLEFVGGDMFKAIPPANAILLKCVLHDWSDEESIKILKRCKEAISSKGGKVIIIDMKVENNEKGDDKSIETQLFFDMLMMILVTGRERTEKEWAKLFVDVSFSGYKITPILGLRSLIEVYP